MRERGRTAAALALAAVFMLFGFLIFTSGRSTLARWPSVGGWLAACGAVWAIAGPAMFFAGLWILSTLGRPRLPFWIGGAGAVLAGAVLVVGVLTYVVPCSGPS